MKLRGTYVAGLMLMAAGFIAGFVDLWVWAVAPLSQSITLAWGLTSGLVAFAGLALMMVAVMQDEAS